jgi:beta-phosphoglucomutase-like phosphatase (HAD superfamily)
MVDAALLELEGVVFDTRELRRNSLDDALGAHGLGPTIDDDLLGGGAPRASAVAALSRQGIADDAVLLDLVVLAAERNFTSRLVVTGAALYDGALDFVRETSANARLAAVTHARRADTETMLRLASLSEFFTLVVSADDVLDPKPAAEGHRLAIERLSRRRPLAPSATIAIESGAEGIRAARTAGVRCVAVGPIPAHVAMEADAYVPSIAGQTIRALDALTRPGQEHLQ